MKIKALFVCHVSILVLVFCSKVPVWAGHPVYSIVPGRSIASLKIGMRRSAVWLSLGKPSETHKFLSGMAGKNTTPGPYVIEDDWLKPNSQWEGVSVLYSNDRIIQIEDTRTLSELADHTAAGDNFSVVLRKRHHMRLSAYDYHYFMGGESVGGHEGYVYDDQANGVAFYMGTQDPSANSGGILGKYPNSRAGEIESIIVHPKGFTVIPLSHGAKLTEITPDHVMTLPFLYAHLRKG